MMKHLYFNLILLFLLIKGISAQDISPYLYGQNHWMADNDEQNRPGYLNQLWPKVEESGIQLVRYGGNGYEHRFPSKEKLKSIIDSIRGIGAEPLLQIPRGYSAKEAAELVKELKFSNGKGVRFYSIGNEPLLHNRSTIEEVYEYVTRIAPAMKAADPDIKIFIFDESSLMKEKYETVVGGKLDLTGKDKNGNWMVDGITFHNYPNGPEFDREDVVFTGPFKIRRQVEQLLEMIEKANLKNNRTGDAKLMWGLTEVNVTYVNPDREISGTGNTSYLGGQFIAEMYGLGLQYGAFTVSPWCISETDRIKTDFGYIGLPSEFYPRSAYYHTQMMAHHMTGDFLPSKSSNSYVKSIASVNDDEICIMILNEDKVRDFSFDIMLNKNGDSSKPLLIHVDAGLENTITGNIPNQTTMLFVISKSGEVKKQYTYGLKHNLEYLPPEVKIF